jgi:DNA-binding transcriptional ArsR family regulator
MTESRPAADAAGMDTKEARLAHPSGFLSLTRHQSVPVVIDALLGLPPGKEFTKTELADFAGVTRQTIGARLPRLLDHEVVEPVPESSPQRYRVADSEVVEALVDLNGALNAAAGGDGR